MTEAAAGATRAARKPLLFVSARCEYCRTVTAFLKQHGLIDAFGYFSVDAHRNQIPRFVTSVPTMLLPDMRMLTDESVWEYVRRLADARKVQATRCAEVAPVHATTGGLGGFESIEGGASSVVDDGLYVRFDAHPSITGVTSGDPSKPLSEADIMAGMRRGMSAGGGGAPMGPPSFEMLKRQRESSMNEFGPPPKDAPIMGGSLTGA